MSRLIPIDKGEGAVQPIGAGEVIRRICGKCVMNIAKRDVVEASGSLQLCAGQKSGSEAAIHAMHRIFEADNTDVVLLIDASNTFNSLNRAVLRLCCSEFRKSGNLCNPFFNFFANILSKKISGTKSRSQMLATLSCDVNDCLAKDLLSSLLFFQVLQ